MQPLSYSSLCYAVIDLMIILSCQLSRYDCGLFMLKYIDFYSRGLGLKFSQVIKNISSRFTFTSGHDPLGSNSYREDEYWVIP